MNTYTIKARHLAYLQNLTKLPICPVCGKEHFRIVHGEFKNTCSSKCYKLLRELNALKKNKETKCILCSKAHSNKSKTCSMSCAKQFQFIKKLGLIDEVKEFKEVNPTTNLTFNQIAICFKNNLIKNNVLTLPKCPVCGKEYLKFKGSTIRSTCGTKCANEYKGYKDIDLNEVNAYCKNFKSKLTFKEKITAFKNKSVEIKCLTCGELMVTSRDQKYCCNVCSQKRNITNIENYNLKFIKNNFISDNLFKMSQCMDYFNLSYTTMLRFKHENKIMEPNKDTTQNEIFKFLNNGNFKENDRTLLYPKEIDILGENFGVEYDGLMWHSFGKSTSSIFNTFENETQNKFNHLYKTDKCEEKGIQLFHIFENEWLNKKEIWKSVLNSKMGNTSRIYARKCSIKEVSSSEAREFCEKNHLQGYVNSSVRIGLFYCDELVQIMTFGKSRSSKWKGQGTFELLRLCSKIDISVTGGASKLMKYFERKYSPKQVLSYANRRWSMGNVYFKLGFEFIENTKPNYFYFKEDNVLKSRVQFQKHRLQEKLENFDCELSETENMYNNGYRKIYDSGNKTFIKTFT